ncbi:MAG TPA: 3-oxoacyl-ACP reductase family protein [Anaeromyxobacteraceae bacterium]|nr:3-oxoacyl-ACP reductase family protein [Anaeromyxobacteraceae bacterium]
MEILKDRVALVTGASRGIGAAVARLLASHGAQVVVNYASNEEAARRVLAEISSGGKRAMLARADVTIREEVDAMVKAAEHELGPVEILVNNANMSFPVQPFVEYRWADFERKLTNEMKGSFFTCQAVVPGMIQRRKGCIVNVSSGLSRTPGPGFVAHSSAKSALDAFSKSLALELGPHGIRVNVVAPGLTRTDATAHQPREMHDAMAARTPLRRLAEPSDVAGAVLFLCADWSRDVTGTYLPVSGGIHMP